MSEAAQLGPTDDGTVMLDIGGDIGALVILTGVELHGVEIEISPLDGGAEDVFQRDHGPGHPHGHAHPHDHSHDHGHTHDHDHGHGHGHDQDGPTRTHVAVRERRGVNGVRYAAIYPGLHAGRYTVHGTDGQAADTVSITGGEVAELDWR